MDQLKIQYFQVCDIWKRFCEKHGELLDLTCKEYSALLKCDLDELEELTASKQTIIDQISGLDKVRSTIIKELAVETNEEIHDIGSLLIFFKNQIKLKDEQHLSKYNALLIDVIEKLQTQNIKNQKFISKAMVSIDEIKASVKGKTYSTYDSKGANKKNINHRTIPGGS